MDLFEAQSLDALGTPSFDPNAPLAVRMRPRTIGEVVGQEAVLAEGSPLRRLLEGAKRGAPQGSSLVLWGPPGTGKTTLAYLVARAEGRRFEELSAVSSGVKDIRDVVSAARRRTATTGEQTVLFIDEVHRFSKSQQDGLLPAVENQWVTLIAATTENPSFSVIPPLLSRSLLLVLEPLDEEAIGTLIDRALDDERGLRGAFGIEEEAKGALIRLAGSDARKSLTLLEAAAGAAADTSSAIINASHIEMAANTALVAWDRDQHYDVASAFIKSMRGSDADAAIHYLARMLEMGEDPRFIARRVMICAAEDVGMAAPEVLSTTVAAAQAVALIGMPEARIILAEAVIAVATAPKSNAAYLAIDEAIADLRAGKGGPVPKHLRDAHYAGAKRLGHGSEYLYAHDAPHHVAAQQYLPDDLEGARYYRPTVNGHEALLTKRLAALRELLAMR
ncbi:replication-associated recombination protein A [Schaalia hyovaginalis]|uniref:replication-associated recombination protein A n=1 Tax=Schaalia hyovaginalis TaxID=29316 RepID=UPI0026F108A6|nr:replication-associated recombination protein A [Schaalia hyovaginalis]MCI6556120.1 replication-associated recombination protein A [Schaalia hyovaginalis]MDD7554645.1 replication-associated recombination protein A [Schaalia hyovaginalis]MDY3094661.1 replication-associated recombination protein A [Schaalia hyovaginalis]